ncbi:MAG: hypothetical protein GC204_19595 [Chloroflexi bacterium]|nr:hypothetical protein [Chloroflexota bacterium]
MPFFEVLAALNTEIVPKICKWYCRANAEDRAGFRARVSEMLYHDLQRKYVPRILDLLICISEADESELSRDTVLMLMRVWRSAEEHWIDPVPFFRTLADNLDPNQRAGMLVSHMLQSR